MEKRHYKDYFSVPADYNANMTREAINVTPETWLDFYPHIKYLDFLQTLFEERKSVWLTGNYGTGKSNAALVTYKLFMDDMARVDKWFENYRHKIVNADNLKRQLIAAREDGILVIYDYNASGLGPNEEFLVRLEKSVSAALREHNYTVPGKANLDLVIERLRREGDQFFKTRDSMLAEMKSLKSDIRTTEQLISKLEKENTADVPVPTHYLDDVQAVFHRDDIYLSVDVPTFRAWIAAICEINKIKRIIYLFDEFSEFIDSNSGTLKTFEDVTEAPAVNHFYLVPITHKELRAFYGENSPGANKAKDRFYFRNLQMPNDIAFQLASHAMKRHEKEPYCSEWKDEKNILWNSIVPVVDRFNDPPESEAYVSRDSFYDILPIHPMTAFLLKFLAESARSSQRSIFEYLKGSADGHEFQEFISKGGPQIVNGQFLTVDYLWKYFMEREDSGQNAEIVAVKMEFDRIKAREFRNYEDDQPEIRVLKTVMLFTLLARLNPNGHDRLQPTIENIELSFRGDGVVIDVNTILRDLAENRHCFSIVNGYIELYSTTVGNEEIEKKKQELSDQFYELLSERCKEAMEQATKTIRGKFSSGRFEIRVSDMKHTTLSNLASSRDQYSTGLRKDDGSICLWFVVAKNKEEQMQIPEKQEALLRNLREHRIIMISFPEITFCEKNISLWDEYIALQAQYALENNAGAKNQILGSITTIENEWVDALKAQSAALDVRYYDTASDTISAGKHSWTDLRVFLSAYIKKALDCCPDILTDQITAFSNKSLKAWALSGIHFSGKAQQGQLVDAFKALGIREENDWFLKNPNHPFSKIRTVLEKGYDNTVGKGGNFSVRKVYTEELLRAPYGMRYNALSAFSLGFCLRWVLEQNCQWTNGQMNHALDDETLAEIIEAAVSLKQDKEKLICCLSEEDKIFAENAGCMFGLPAAEGSTPLETLRLISSNVEAHSCKVPLWILADYIRTDNSENRIVAEVFDELCTAIKISSKGDIDARGSAITEIGKLLAEHSDIIETAASYTKPDVYIAAFQKYVDFTDPNLSDLAQRAGDKSHAYCDLLLEKAASASGWLWNKSDISAIIQEVTAAYQTMILAHSFLKTTGYAAYKEILDRLKKKLSGAVVPYSVINAKFPDAAKFIEAVNDSKDDLAIYKTFHNGISILEKVYNDPKQALIISVIKEYIGELKIDEDSMIALLAEIPSSEGYSVQMSQEAYIKLVRSLIDENTRNAIIARASQEWRRISGFDSPAEWSEESRLPVWTVFESISDGNELVKILFEPNDFTNDALEQKVSILEIVPKVNIKKCQEAFLNKIVPKQYQKLKIELASLLKYISAKFGKNPNKWPEQMDISEFIKEQYQEVFAPEILSKLRAENADTLKEKNNGNGKS
ncbi:MAG TPA: hypothetical protein H9761_14060 [Candidatus Eisenbergiella merdavium]|uniref:Uncharacterized protein n=1 Tax=Candidatus Eisenbergiella merdavium TaxID=2838551 RepID=A0A9D2NIZ8_9FIRM|nr:hypothetical protein [Candidatus Eisenbergiella merdavium]